MNTEPCTGSVAQPRTKWPVAWRLTQEKPISPKGTVHTQVTSTHCLTKGMNWPDCSGGDQLGSFHVSREKVEQRELGESPVCPKHWQFINLISNAVTHRKGPKCTYFRFWGSGMWRQLAGWYGGHRRREEKYQIWPAGQRNAGSDGYTGISAWRSRLSSGWEVRLLQKLPSAGKQWGTLPFYRGLSLCIEPSRTSRRDVISRT